MSVPETPAHRLTPPVDDWHRGEIDDTPAPSGPPVYARSPVQPRRSWTLQEAVDGAFFVLGALLVLWLGGVLVIKGLDSGLDGSVETVVYLIVFWALLAYIALPRLEEMLAKIYVPDYFIGRTLTGIGILGDPINLALNGEAADVHRVMGAAGWTRADPVTLRSSWGIIRSAVFRTSYPAAPVSPLFLFGRPEDFAYEREVDDNANQRHHVRFWKVPEGWVLPGGYDVSWLASATYDRKVGLSLFTLQVTHKVDADIDAERDYVVATARYGTPGIVLRMVEDFSTAFQTRNGGGDVVHGDGNLKILDLGALVPSRGAGSAGAVASAGGPAAAGPAAAATASEREVVRPGPRASRSLDRLLAHRLPPPMLVLAGVISVAKAVWSLVAVLVAVLGSRHGHASHTSTREFIVIGASAGLTITAWALTLARHAWARTVLLAVASADAIGELIDISHSHRINDLLLGTASLAVLILIAVSSAQARRWTTAPARPAVPAGPGA